MNWYLIVDPSYTDPRSTGQYSDFAGMVLVGMDFQRDLYVRHIVRKKMTYSEIIDEIFNLYTNTFQHLQRNMKIVLEVIGTKSLSYEMANEQRRRNTWLPITEIKSRSENKEERIRGLAPFFEYGHIFLIRECPQIDELVLELLQFPTGRHDDIIDPLATVLEVASPPTNRDGGDETRRKHKRLMQYKPRSAITGV